MVFNCRSHCLAYFYIAALTANADLFVFLIVDNLEITNEYGDICGGSFKISDQAAIKLESGSLELSSLETDFLCNFGIYVLKINVTAFVFDL